MMPSEVERIAAMEVRLQTLEEKVDRMDSKLDDLLALKYKGAGAFWLMTVLFGAGFSLLISWIRG